jgi:glutathione S-transferase
MKLYCDPISTTSRPVMLFITEQGLDVELVHVDLMSGANREPAYLVINPNGIVPFLVDGDLALGESSAILKYLAEKIGSPTYPTEIKARAKANEALDWFNTQFHEYFCLFTVYPNFGIPHGLDPVTGQSMVAYGHEHSARWLKVLDQHMLAGRDFVCGDQITVADYLGSAFMTLGDGIGFDLSPYPNVAAWVARMKALPSWDKTYAGFNGFLSAMRAPAQAA